MTTASDEPKGTWISRTAIKLLTLALGILLFWVLGFIVQDIRTIEGPEYKNYIAEYTDKALSSKKQELDNEIQILDRQISVLRNTQSQTEKSSQNLQATIDQLVEIQKLDLQKGTQTPDTKKTNFSKSLNVFLENQEKFQTLNAQILEAVGNKEALELEREAVQKSITAKQEPARKAFEKDMRAHRLKLAFLQMLILVPILIAASVLMMKKRESLYFPFFMAAGGASLVKVGLVAHEYFPTEYFKYILISVLILVVGKILLHFIKNAAKPEFKTLLKQYTDAYKRFLCPVCEFPIRMGPRRFLFWTRRTVNKVLVSGTGDKYEPYTCPSCSTELFNKCSACDDVRHTLLPSCENCGDKKTII